MKEKLLEVELKTTCLGNYRKVWCGPPPTVLLAGLSQASEQKEKSRRTALTINAKEREIDYQSPATAQP